MQQRDRGSDDDQKRHVRMTAEHRCSNEERHRERHDGLNPPDVPDRGAQRRRLPWAVARQERGEAQIEDEEGGDEHVEQQNPPPVRGFGQR